MHRLYGETVLLRCIVFKKVFTDKFALDPCYTKENVDRQRGTGVFEKSITVLKKLNGLGYGSSLELNLVYNPGGDFLPAHQSDLESDYKSALLEKYGIVFNKLFTITNAPIGRFREYLLSSGKYDEYLDLLEQNFNSAAAENVMCKTLISIDWQGYLYNCDFNQPLNLPIRDEQGEAMTVKCLGGIVECGADITTGEHCYCCAAGSGSSCTGQLV